MKNFKSLYGFGERCLKITGVCMDFEPYFKVYNLVSVHPKSIIPGQMINLDMIFHVVVSVYRLIKIWNSSQFPVEPIGMAIQELEKKKAAEDADDDLNTTFPCQQAGLTKLVDGGAW